jgi:hypothetical protein
MTSFLDALNPLVDVFDTYSVAYYIGGSVATIAHGVPRTTLDVDVIADITLNHVEPLVTSLADHFYIQAPDIRDAIIHRSSFNVVHFVTMIKIDVFLAPHRPFDQSKAQRTQLVQLNSGSTRLYRITSAEDIIIQKLEWYAAGAYVSERQWNDIQGVMKIQGTTLDIAYMRHWANQLQLSTLLEKALKDAQINFDGAL